MIPKGYTWGGHGWVCQFCRGKGCLSCPALPPPPVLAEQPTEPLLSATWDELADHTSEAFRVFKAAVGRDAVVKAFSPGGGGHAEVRENIAREREAIARERAGKDQS